MAESVPAKYYTLILENLIEHLPDSAVVYHVTKTIKDGIPSGFQLWVDRLINPTAFVISADSTSCTNEYRKMIVFAYGTTDEGLCTILKTQGVVDFSRKLLFFGLTKPNLLSIKHIFPEKEFSDGDTCFLYQANSATKIKDIRLPDGFHGGDFTRDTADLIASRWDFAEIGVEDDMYDTYKWGFPTIVIYNENNEVVAWVMRHLAGVISYLHVEEPYRRRGIASAILSMIAKIVIERDGFVVSTIIKTNEKSIRLHEKVGFERVRGDGFFFTLVK